MTGPVLRIIMHTVTGMWVGVGISRLPIVGDRGLARDFGVGLRSENS